MLAVLTGIPGIWLVYRVSDAHADPGGTPGEGGSGLTDGLLAGLGFGVLFAALDQVSDGAGLATAIAQGASTLTAAASAVATGGVWSPLAQPSGRRLGRAAQHPRAALLPGLDPQGSLTVSLLMLYPRRRSCWPSVLHGASTVTSSSAWCCATSRSASWPSVDDARDHARPAAQHLS